MDMIRRQEDDDAWFSRADRFDGFDRGDTNDGYEAAQLAENEAFYAEMLAEEAANVGGAA